MSHENVLKKLLSIMIFVHPIRHSSLQFRETRHLKTCKMHYSQLKKQGSSNRQGGLPGTPRPNLEPDSKSPRHHHRHSHITALTKDDHDEPIPSAPTDSPQPHFTFNFKKKSSKEKKERKKCDLPKYEGQVSPTLLGENLPSYLVWVKNEPFDFGILSPLPCPKIGINILRKIAEYCREKPGHFPELSLNQWAHICKYKMQLATDLCFTYFRVFDVLTRCSSTWTKHYESTQGTGQTQEKSDASESWDAKFNRVYKQGHDAQEEFKVDTMQFLLFLYLQHFHRLHKKYFLKSCGDEPWPKAWVSTLMQRSGSPVGTGTNVPEQQQAEFIMANLSDMIDFLMLVYERKEYYQTNRDPEERASSAGGSDKEIISQRIPMEVLKALSLVLGVATITPDREFRTLDECLHSGNLRIKLEYSRYSRTIDKRKFVLWVMKNLNINPWGPSSVPIPQVAVSLITGVWEDVDCFKKNKIYWNTQTFPKTWYLVSGVEKQVLVLDTLDPMSSVKIHRCTNSYLYLPGVYRYLLVQKCHGVTLNVGVTCKVIKFSDCSSITVSAVGRQFIISDVSHSTFHLLTPSCPVICGSKNHEILLAPYNTSYPNLVSHMKMAGLSTKIQKWGRPMEIASDGFLRAFQQSNVLPLVPEQFRLVPFPFKQSGSTANVTLNVNAPLTGTLPGAYQRRLDIPLENMEKARKEFCQKLMYSEDDTNLIYQITLQRFRKWLKECGYYDQIVGLRSYQKSLEQDRSTPILCSKGHDLSCVAKALKNFFKRESSNAGTVKSATSIGTVSSRTSRRSSGKFEPGKSARGGAGDEGNKMFDAEIDAEGNDAKTKGREHY